MTIHVLKRGTVKVAGFATADRQGYEVRENPGFDHDVRLMVEGARGVGFGLTAVDPDQWYNLGPHLGTAQGPRVGAYGLPGVIDNHGGSKREIEQAKAEGLLVEAKVGDVLALEMGKDNITRYWQIDFYRRGSWVDHHNIELQLVAETVST